MDLRPLAALALVTSLAPLGGPAHADPVSGPTGLPCRYVPAGDPTAPAGTGVLVGGPYLATGTLTCTVGGWDAAPEATAIAQGGPVLVAAGLATYSRGLQLTTAVCTSFTPPGGATLYLNHQVAGDPGIWSIYRGWCGTSPDPRLPTDPGTLWEWVADLLTTCDDCGPNPVDAYTCAALVMLYPGAPPAVVVEPEGDVYVDGQFFWDCPPYAPAE
jgi:hypothetical protein